MACRPTGETVRLAERQRPELSKILSDKILSKLINA
jgi:hypothetical protein